MQIHAIAQSLKEITADTPALANKFPGGLWFGERAGSDTEEGEGLVPYGLIDVTEAESEGISAGVRLVTYDVVLTVVVTQRIQDAGAILETFHQYWDRILVLPSLTNGARLVGKPHPGASGMTEAPNKQLGKDVIEASTSWTLRLPECRVAPCW